MKKILILLLAVCSLKTTAIAQPVLTVLASFGSATVTSPSPSPSGALTLGNDGNLYYATTVYPHVYPYSQEGAFFRISTNGSLTMLATIPPSVGAASQPMGGLTLGNDGSFYGLAIESGGFEVFRVTTNGVETTVTTSDYLGLSMPQLNSAGLTLAQDGSFYGTIAQSGSLVGNAGGVFRVTTNGAATMVVSFTFAGIPVNGEYLQSGVTFGPDGNLYGANSLGGSNGSGTVFRLTTNGVLTTLLSLPSGYSGLALTLGSDGNFYGTSGGGGNATDGAVFRLTTNGILTTVASFNGTNGAYPAAGLTLGLDGSFYGTTYGGGNLSLNGGYGFGTIFRVSTNGLLTTLVSFNSTNGAFPDTSLTWGNSGVLYGTTSAGGSGGSGTFFSLVIPPPPLLGTTTIGGLPVVVYPASGTNYTLQTSTNVASGNWVTITNGIPYTGVMITNAPANAFFRLCQGTPQTSQSGSK